MSAMNEFAGLVKNRFNCSRWTGLKKGTFVSMLQKALRRAEVQLALESAAEYDLSGIANALFGRLFVIACEDFGRGCPWMFLYIHQQYQRWLDALPGPKSKKKTSESFRTVAARNIVVETVLFMADKRWKRCRTGPTSLAVTLRDAFAEKEDESHSMKECKSAVAEFATVLSQVEEKEQKYYRLLSVFNWLDLNTDCGFWAGESIQDLWALMTKANTALKPALEVLKKWSGRDSARLFYAHAIYLCVFQPSLQQPQYTPAPVLATAALYSMQRPPPMIPDWAFDKHTPQGRQMKRDIGHFRTVGAQCVNGLVDPYEEDCFAFYEAYEKRRGTDKARTAHMKKEFAAMYGSKTKAVKRSKSPPVKSVKVKSVDKIKKRKVQSGSVEKKTESLEEYILRQHGPNPTELTGATLLQAPTAKHKKLVYLVGGSMIWKGPYGGKGDQERLERMRHRFAVLKQMKVDVPDQKEWEDSRGNIWMQFPFIPHCVPLEEANWQSQEVCVNFLRAAVGKYVLTDEDGGAAGDLVARNLLFEPSGRVYALDLEDRRGSLPDSTQHWSRHLFTKPPQKKIVEQMEAGFKVHAVAVHATLKEMDVAWVTFAGVDRHRLSMIIGLLVNE